jgi:hypothetical protein
MAEMMPQRAADVSPPNVSSKPTTWAGGRSYRSTYSLRTVHSPSPFRRIDTGKTVQGM